jgi:tetratricopeptide (TPR) repeat protein
MNQHQHIQELEKNELLEWCQKKFGFLKPHFSKILMGIVFLGVVIFGLVYYSEMQKSIKDSQWQQLYLAMNNQFAVPGDTSFSMMAENDPEAPASMWALQMAGDQQLRDGLSKFIGDRAAALKEIEKARKSYETVVNSKVDLSSMLRQRATYGLAYALESLGKFDEAKKYYAELLESAPKGMFAKACDRALDRLAQPDLLKIWEEYKTVGTAPSAPLGELPDDISFPDLTAPAAGTDSGEPSKGDGAESTDAESKSDASDGDGQAAGEGEKAEEKPSEPNEPASESTEESTDDNSKSDESGEGGGL